MLSSLFFKYSPLKRFRVKEKSMEPYLSPNSIVLAVNYFFLNPKVGDVIVFRHPTPPYIFIKRVKKIIGKKIWVEGDNKIKSIDSRSFGFIPRDTIIGKVMKKL